MAYSSSYKHTVILLVALVIGMIGLSFASAPLYRLFCQRTGYGGTPQVALMGAVKRGGKVIQVRFNADVNRQLPWDFSPLQQEIRVRVGEPAIAFYQAHNRKNDAVVGIATYNVTPDKAGIYFNKIECFCFEEQRLEAQQTVEMPVHFFIDPEIENDPHLQDVSTITLSYTFFPLKAKK